MTLIVEHEGMDFVGLQVERALLEALILQLLRNLILQFQLRLQIAGSSDLRRSRSGSLQPCANGVVLQLSFIADDRAIDAGRLQSSRGIHHEFDHDAQAILIFEQRACAGGKFFGEHGEIADSRVDGGGFAGGVPVNRCLLGDKGVDVRNADHDFHVAIRGAFGDFNLIEVARRIVVDGGPEQIAQVAEIASRGDLRRMGFQVGKLLRNLRREIRLEAVALHDCFCGGLQVELRSIDVGHELPVRKWDGFRLSRWEGGMRRGAHRKRCRLRLPKSVRKIARHTLDGKEVRGSQSRTEKTCGPSQAAFRTASALTGSAFPPSARSDVKGEACAI